MVPYKGNQHWVFIGVGIAVLVIYVLLTIFSKAIKATSKVKPYDSSVITQGTSPWVINNFIDLKGDSPTILRVPAGDKQWSGKICLEYGSSGKKVCYHWDRTKNKLVPN